jgi:hypothetical protein
MGKVIFPLVLTPMHKQVPFSVGSEKLGTIVISSSFALKYICSMHVGCQHVQGCGVRLRHRQSPGGAQQPQLTSSGEHGHRCCLQNAIAAAIGTGQASNCRKVLSAVLNGAGGDRLC